MNHSKPIRIQFDQFEFTLSSPFCWELKNSGIDINSSYPMQKTNLFTVEMHLFSEMYYLITCIMFHQISH